MSIGNSPIDRTRWRRKRIDGIKFATLGVESLWSDPAWRRITTGASSLQDPRYPARAAAQGAVERNAASLDGRAMNQEQVGQGLTEYAMAVSLLSVVAIVGLLLLGPAVGQFLDTAGYQLGTAGAITGVIAERAGHGQGNTIHVTVGVARDTRVKIYDAQSGETVGPDPCHGSCLVILAGVGPAAGTLTVTTDAGHTVSAEYAARP